MTDLINYEKNGFTENRKVCLTYSAGGHYAELLKAIDGLNFTNTYHVTFKSGRFSNDDSCERYYLTHPQKKVGRTLLNAIQSFYILLKKRPKIIISTGADVTVSTLILGKLFFRCKVIFIESAGDLKPTLTGRLVYKFSDIFIVQWPEKLKFFPKAILSEGILL